MKIYWSDRQGRPAPTGATFHLRSFCSKIQLSAPLDPVLLPPPASVKVVSRTFSPSKDMWTQNIKEALNTKIPKVVLARKCVLELAIVPDPFAITAALKQKAQGSFVFCIQGDGFAFLGASPERLFSRQGTLIQSEAVAGTRPRGNTPHEDEALQNELLHSSKDLREVNPVKNYLREHLNPLCTSEPLFSPLTIHQTQNVQHLYASCSATLKREISDEELLRTLHPTPALCGSPKNQAFDLIQKLEPFERGFYGGIIGWQTPKASEYIVAIRSCLLVGKTATLFSGTGIVEGSDPDAEWDELDEKLKLYDAIFTR